MKDCIYLDNNSTTKVDPKVIKEILPCFDMHYGNATSATHPFGWYAKELAEIARERIAKTINAKPEEIYFTSGATEANNLVISGFLAGTVVNIYYGATEHQSIIAPTLNRCPNAIKLKTDSNGEVLAESLERQLKTKSKNLICISLANNEIGTINKIKELRAACKDSDFFHCDATQGLGKIPINVKDLKIDSLSLSAHKAYGPKGIGALYIKSGRRKEISPQTLGGGQEEGYRSGTLNIPAIVGFGKASELATQNLESHQKHLLELSKLFLSEISKSLEIKLNGPDINQRLPGNLNFQILINKKPIDSAKLISKLSAKVALSNSSACSSSQGKISHVLQEIGLTKSQANSSIRVGFSKFNTKEETTEAAKLVSKFAISLAN